MDRKNTLLLTVIAVATLLVAVVGATFAYFTAQTGAGASANVTVTTSTSDALEYGSFGAIVINANQQNFAEGMGNQTGTTTGNVTLKANADNEASYCYTAAINVTSNDFVYTTEAKTPELIFTISKNGTAIYTDQDITEIAAGDNALTIPTTAGGSDLIHKITAAAGNTVSDAWSATVTLVNLDSDQQENTNKQFVGTLNFATTECPTTP